MNAPRPTVALIHASPASVSPAREAFASEFPEADLWNLLDDRLVVDADLAGGLTPDLENRMSTLIQYALDGGAAAVQLSCSMYGPVAAAAAQRSAVPVFASDQAMFQRVRDTGVARVGILGSLDSAVSDSVERLTEFLGARSAVSIAGRTVDGAAKAASAGDEQHLVSMMVAAAETMAAQEVDVLVVAQYSLAPARDAMAAAVDIPVLSPPHLAASTLRDALKEGSGS